MRIRPCPFCGGASNPRMDGGRFFRECFHCKATGPRQDNAQAADDAWNLTKERDEAVKDALAGGNVSVQNENVIKQIDKNFHFICRRCGHKAETDIACELCGNEMEDMRLQKSDQRSR